MRSSSNDEVRMTIETRMTGNDQSGIRISVFIRHSGFGLRVYPQGVLTAGAGEM